MHSKHFIKFTKGLNVFDTCASKTMAMAVHIILV